ncbi:MAG: hypothetical protein SAK29_33295 [Scytonema sp. PMC 1069.18]|nr:hypothetical protein [Scytonema sp. PMC 1069.18]MEC4886857.1 hypothetical protein [Scytonema sp. PMC 1070.18]
MQDLLLIKAEAKKDFRNVSGIKGFGIGKNSLRIYVTNQDVINQLPDTYMGVKVDFLVEPEDFVPHKISIPASMNRWHSGN